MTEYSEIMESVMFEMKIGAYACAIHDAQVAREVAKADQSIDEESLKKIEMNLDTLISSARNRGCGTDLRRLFSAWKMIKASGDEILMKDSNFQLAMDTMRYYHMTNPKYMDAVEKHARGLLGYNGN